LYWSVLIGLFPGGLALAFRRAGRERLAARFGFYPAGIRELLAFKQAPRVWIHAVSAGEVAVAFAVVRALRCRFPDLEVVLSTTTRDGRRVASRDQARETVIVIDSPFDLPGVIRRLLAAIQPDLLVLVELELWPNLLESARLSRVPVTVVNARMPEKETWGYGRLGFFFRPLFESLRLVLAQSDNDATRFAALGVPGDRVRVTGNVKFDAVPMGAYHQVPPETQDLLQTVCLAGRHPVIVAGSTHPGEEQIMLRLAWRLRADYPNLLLVLVPRHITRASAILRLAEREGFVGALRCGMAKRGLDAVEALIVDSMGELRFLYPLATVIFVGKSLCGKGGQNVIEAAASGNPVGWGPHMEHFREVAGAFVREEAAVQVAAPGELEDVIRDLLGDPARRAAVGSRALEVIKRNRGAAERAAEALAGFLQGTQGTQGTESSLSCH